MQTKLFSLKLWIFLLNFFIIFQFSTKSSLFVLAQNQFPDCQNLRFGQYQCIVDSEATCASNRTLPSYCFPLTNVQCIGERNWTIYVPCRYTTSYSWSIALGLSVFLGNCGIDRCYLGYPTLGVLKFFTFGGFIIGNIIDMILIGTQSVVPADGSDYILWNGAPSMLKSEME